MGQAETMVANSAGDADVAIGSLSSALEKANAAAAKLRLQLQEAQAFLATA